MPDTFPIRFSFVKAFILLNLLFSITACQKEIDEKISAAEKLTSARWQLKQLLLENPPGSAPADITAATFDPCELDDLIEFKPGGNYFCDENTNVCSVNSSFFYATRGGNWAISGDTALAISKGLISQSFRLGKVSSTSAEFRQLFTNYLGEPLVYIFIFRPVK